MTPGTYSRPAEPMPFTRPNLAPLADTHSGPFGPSTTCGMRSLNCGRGVLGEEIGRQPDQVDMAIGGDDVVFHGHGPPGAIIAPKAAPPTPYGIAQRYMRAQLRLGVASSTATVESDRIRPIGRIASLPAEKRMSRL